jgi:hypothetical protein
MKSLVSDYADNNTVGLASISHKAVIQLALMQKAK